VPQNKFEGVTDRNYTTYNPQVVRDDVFMLGIDGTVKRNRMAVIRSSSAVVVSSQNASREWVYSQQQTFSAEGYSGQAFNPRIPPIIKGISITDRFSPKLTNTAVMTFKTFGCAANIFTPRMAPAASKFLTSRTSTKKDFRRESSARRSRRSASARGFTPNTR